MLLIGCGGGVGWGEEGGCGRGPIVGCGPDLPRGCWNLSGNIDGKLVLIRIACVALCVFVKIGL